MNISSLNLKKTKKTDLINSILNNTFETPTRNQKKEIQRTIEQSIKSGNYTTALNALIIGITFDSEISFDNLRKRGLFRYSNYINKKPIINALVKELIEFVQIINYTVEKNTTYLKSINELEIFHSSFKELNLLINKKIISFDRKHKNKSLVKTLLAFTDYLFLKNYFPDEEKKITKLSSRNKEDICAATSYIIYKISEIRDLNKKDCNPISEEYITKDDILKIITYAVYIIDLKEFEILIDNFNYKCERNDKSIKIYHENPNLQKSINLGYIRTDVQAINDSLPTNKETEILSLEKFVEDLYKHQEFNFFEYTESNDYPRYRIVIPEIAIDFIFDKFLSPNLLFKEEAIYLSKVYKEQLINYDDLQKIKLKDNITLYDFIKINRVFSLIYLLFAKKIFEIEKENPILILRSLIPSFSEEQLYGVFSKLFTEKQIDEYLDLVCWDDGLDIIFDLQYHPIIYIENTFLISLSILSNSNLLRNVYASEYKRDNKNLLSNGVIDPITDILSESLIKINITPYSNTEIQGGEIDLFFIFDDTLFVVECKHTLHPTSVFDLRTTYDYVLKAEKQIDNIINLFSENILLDILENKYNLDLSSVTKIEPCIILSNRLFNGNVFKYSIRNLNEFKNLISRGTVSTKDGVFKFWNEEKITKEDFIHYFSEKNIFYSSFYETLEIVKNEYNFMKPMLEFDTYSLNILKAEESMREITKNLTKVDTDPS